MVPTKSAPPTASAPNPLGMKLAGLLVPLFSAELTIEKGKAPEFGLTDVLLHTVLKGFKVSPEGLSSVSVRHDLLIGKWDRLSWKNGLRWEGESLLEVEE